MEHKLTWFFIGCVVEGLVVFMLGLFILLPDLLRLAQ